MVATMRNLLLICVCVFLSACDHFPGPNVRSEFTTPVKLIVTYSDGETFSHEWPSCRVYGLGAMGVGRLGVKPKEDVTIELVVIEAKGRVIHRFDKAAINSLLEKEKAEGNYPIWVVDESGIHFSTDRECSLNHALQ